MDQPVVAFGKPRAERSDAARNRLHLLAVAREMLAEQGADSLTMDGLAERASLGKGTVFRRFGSRAGIFRALLDEEERAFQDQVLSGPPPLGPGAAPLDRLIAYGRARAAFLMGNRAIARASLDGGDPHPAGGQTPLSQVHIRMLIGQLDLGAIDLDLLSLQLTAALDAPLLLYLSVDDLAGSDREMRERIAQSWQDLITRVCVRLLQSMATTSMATTPTGTSADGCVPASSGLSGRSLSSSTIPSTMTASRQALAASSSAILTSFPMTLLPGCLTGGFPTLNP